MDNKAIAKVVEEQEWLEPLADSVSKAVGAAYEAGGEASAKVKDALHGTWLGHPLHPVLTDIPIGAWTASMALDVLGAGGNKAMHKASDACIGIGLVGAVGAAATGLTDWHVYGEKGPKRVGMMHALLNGTATMLYGASWVMRRRGARPTGVALSWLGGAVATAAAYLGGNLVYRQRVGVDHSSGAVEGERFVSVLPLEDLPENQPKRVQHEGLNILLVRQGTQVFALEETCSHYGGPLAEGKLEEDTIRCPWHGSRFCLHDGSVVEGPATFPQPSFETRIVDGQIEVKLPAQVESRVGQAYAA